MIKRIHFNAYRKLKDIDVEFAPGINAIAGANGTCKSSILHIISNSFQAVSPSSEWLDDPKCIKTIRRVNMTVNPKIETLTRGDKEYSDPAQGVSGTLFSVNYFSGQELAFRRHNSRKGSGDGRFSVKPYYPVGKHETLPAIPVIYLGLARLYPYGEYSQDDQVKDVRGDTLPQEHLDRLIENYKKFTLLDASVLSAQAMGDIKRRSEFTTGSQGIDSNTISAGEDNLFIMLTALESLAYYHERVVKDHDASSILLIDELDASLHPAFQIKLMDLFAEYAEAYSIQIVFTTHSLTLLDYLMSKKENVIYLQDNLSDVIPMNPPDMYRIKMDLSERAAIDIYAGKYIPVFSEDAQARLVLKELFDFFAGHSKSFSRVYHNFHFVDGDIGADNLKGLFRDVYLQQSTMASICILDGDKGSNLKFNTIKLPGGNSPEEWLLGYARKMVSEDDPFWKNQYVLDLGYSKKHFLGTISSRFDAIDEEINQKHETGESAKSIRRRKYKKAFDDHQQFFLFVMRRWLIDSANNKDLIRFYGELHKMFMKVCSYHGIDRKAWPADDNLHFD